MLLRHALGVDRNRLFQRLNEPVEAGPARRFQSYVERRLQREPSAYITGRREFFGLDLVVNQDTLIPRPETETLVTAASDWAQTRRSGRIRIADIGTGSGAVALALAATAGRAEVYATDVSEPALAVARENARRLRLERRVVWRRGSLLDPIDVYLDIIVANLPYISSEVVNTLEPEVRLHEPRLALEASGDGLELIRALLRQAPRYLRPGGLVLLEFGDGQAEAVVTLARERFSNAAIEALRDGAGRQRVLSIDTRSRD